MSKLADRIRKTSHTEPAPLGFAPIAAAKAAPTMLTLVWLSANEAGKASEAAAKGADGVIVDGIDPKKLKEQGGKADGIVVGVRPPKAARDIVASLKQAGADFAVVEADSSMADALLEENMGYVLSAKTPLDDTRLRLLAELGLDALIVEAPPPPVTMERMLDLRRIASLSRTPLLAEIAPDADASLLQVLRDSGVTGVVIDASGIGKLQALRERIASLPARGRRKEEHADAVIPAQAAHAHDEEDDGDDY